MTKRPPRQQRWADDLSGMVQNYVVYEPEQEIDTGLLDRNGSKIVRARQPVGFDLSGRRTAAPDDSKARASARATPNSDPQGGARHRASTFDSRAA